MSIRKIISKEFEQEVGEDFQSTIVPKVNDFIRRKFTIGTEEIGLSPNIVMKTIKKIVNSYKF